MRGSETRVGVSACAASFRVVPCDGATCGIMFSILWATCGMSTHAWHMEMRFVMPCVASHFYFMCHVWYEHPRVALTLT